MSEVKFGGQHVPAQMEGLLVELETAYNQYKNDPEFVKELKYLLNQYTGRPSILYFAEKMTKDLGGAKVYLKREDLNHTGSHKINNVLGQVLLAKRMGKTRVIAETGAGQHGVATATAAALMDIPCVVYMGAEDMRRQALNVFRMKMLGAEVVAVHRGTSTLQDAVDEALDQWAANPEGTFYVLGSAVGPAPYPEMVRDFQKIIGEEAKAQILEAEGRLPDAVIACIGGGSNAIGAFYDFVPNKEVRLIGVEAAGRGIDTNAHAASITKGQIGTFHGMTSYFLQNEKGEISPAYSISAGLDYPGVGPEHAELYAQGREEIAYADDEEAIDAFLYLSKLEGIIPAIESSHAVAYARKLAPTMNKDQIIIINLSGRGDKDVSEIAAHIGIPLGI